MRLIDAIGLKQSLAVYAILEQDKTLEQIIDEQPTIEERKTGRWIDAQYPFSKCDQCGAYMDTVNNEANYCCVCGAKMEVEHETDNVAILHQS